MENKTEAAIKEFTFLSAHLQNDCIMKLIRAGSQYKDLCWIYDNGYSLLDSVLKLGYKFALDYDTENNQVIYKATFFNQV